MKIAQLLQLDDEAFIDNAYQIILHRAADVEGKNYYIARLRGKDSKINILVQLRESAEGRAWAAKFPAVDVELKHYRPSRTSNIRIILNLFRKKKKFPAMQDNLTNVADRPLKFIAHDGGFFSNFNYLIGEIYSGKKVYPLFSLQETLRYTKEIKHFAYLDANCQNSWLEFFKPIKYSPNDNANHDAKYLSNLPETMGYACLPEFRIPSESIKLYRQKNFVEWRTAVHNVVANKIQVTDEISSLISVMLAKMGGHRIAVHIRHPSHTVEQGNVFFQNYYDVIDKILKRHLDSNIFIASDNELALAAFTQRYGDKIFYYPNFIRESIDSVLEWAYSLMDGKLDEMGFVNGKAFQTHHKLAAIGNGRDGIRAGKEAVTDLFTLAGCDEFVCTASNFTLACAYLNPRLELHIISSGR